MPYLEINGKVNWQEKKKFLKISLPVNLKNQRIFCEIPMSFVERKDDGEEHPFQRWIKISGDFKNEKYGICVINDGFYGYDFDGKELRLSILRSPRFAYHHSLNTLGKEKILKESDYIDNGINRFKLWLIPYKNDNINPSKYATFLNKEIEYILPLSHKGILPSENSFVKVEKENIIVEVLKKGEDGNFLILRAYETSGKLTETNLEIFGKKYRVNFGKFEIKTLKIKDNKITEVNLLEK